MALNYHMTYKCRLSFILALILAILTSVGAQEEYNVLTFSDYVKILRYQHPVSYQAGLWQVQADGETLMARGNFDPKLEGNFDHKSFDDKNYYALLGTSLKIPTWFGADIKASYERASGDFLNESDLLPPRGIWSLGVSMPLGRGLMFDERRAQVQQAEVFQKASEQEQIFMLNELFYEGINAYLEWQVQYQLYAIALEGLTLAEDRFVATRSSFINGDKPAIDTLESFISVQNRQQDLWIAQQELRNSGIYLQNFLWIDGYIPLELDNNVRPERLSDDLYASTIDSLSLIKIEILNKHPELLLYQYKVESLQIDQRLNREFLKPDLQVYYNPLIGSTQDRLFADYSINNLKVGATFSYPLFLRKERAKIQLTDVKIQDVEYELGLKRQNLSLKLDAILNDARTMTEQMVLQSATITNYRDLLQGERTRFNIGESSVFLLNSREISYLSSQRKLIELRFKLFKSRLSYILYTGQLSTM